MKKSLFGALLLFVLAACSPRMETVVILSTNDIHAHIEKFPQLAEAVKKCRDTVKNVILVDHNERGQAVDGIENANILELIDHHRLGTVETVGPVFFRNQPLGCTATIIFQMYREQGLEIDKTIAGLLCSAIISDTVSYTHLTLPTT